MSARAVPVGRPEPGVACGSVPDIHWWEAEEGEADRLDTVPNRLVVPDPLPPHPAVRAWESEAAALYPPRPATSPIDLPPTLTGPAPEPKRRGRHRA